jgi:hypothetical protein
VFNPIKTTTTTMTDFLDLKKMIISVFTSLVSKCE